MEEAGNQIVLIEKETLAELRDRLSKRRSPDILIIDSVHYWLGFKIKYETACGLPAEAVYLYRP